jgi:hypothetical protein
MALYVSALQADLQRLNKQIPFIDEPMNIAPKVQNI